MPRGRTSVSNVSFVSFFCNYPGSLFNNFFFQFRKRERERVYHSIKWGNGEPETLTHLFLKYPLAQIICSQSPWPLRFNSLNFARHWGMGIYCQMSTSFFSFKVMNFITSYYVLLFLGRQSGGKGTSGSKNLEAQIQ